MTASHPEPITSRPQPDSTLSHQHEIPSLRSFRHLMDHQAVMLSQRRAGSLIRSDNNQTNTRQVPVQLTESSASRSTAIYLLTFPDLTHRAPPRYLPGTTPALRALPDGIQFPHRARDKTNVIASIPRDPHSPSFGPTIPHYQYQDQDTTQTQERPPENPRKRGQSTNINMPSFIEDLWSSVFIPGPTPTLLIATNVTFAALQLVLLALLLATASVHFIVLSALSAGLWWSINWFAREVRLAQAAQETGSGSGTGEGEGVGEKDGSPAPPGAILESGESDTETEGVNAAASAAAAAVSGSGSGLHPPGRQEVRKRASMGGDNSSGYGSTDSEWEKVDGQ